MVYPEYLAFWIILLPFLLQNNGGIVLAQNRTTEIFETLALYNETDATDFTRASIWPSSSIVQTTTTTTAVTTETETAMVINSTVTTSNKSDLNETFFEVASRLPTDDGLPTKITLSGLSSYSPFPSLTPYCSQPFDCISNSIFFDIATFLHSSSSTTNNGTSLTCFQSINSCNNFCSRYFGGECYRFSSSLASIDSLHFFNPNTNIKENEYINCGNINVVCFYSYFWIFATTMILTTLAIISAIIAAYKFIKSRRSSSVTLISFRYTGNFPDLRDLYNNGEQIDLQLLQPYDSVHFDNENGNVTLMSSKK